MKKVKLFLSLFLMCGSISAFAEVQSFKIETQKAEFSARFTASPSVNNANIGIGFGGEEISGWPSMNCIINFGPDGEIVVRNGETYTAWIYRTKLTPC